MPRPSRQNSLALVVWGVLAAALALGGSRLAAVQSAAAADQQLAVATPGEGLPQADDRPGGEADEEGASKSLRLREGTRLANRTGRFRMSGETLTFVDENERELTGLPNLNLERISRLLKALDEPESVSWSVSGTVTEFSGRNYVLISRAVYKSSASQASAGP